MKKLIISLLLLCMLFFSGCADTGSTGIGSAEPSRDNGKADDGSVLPVPDQPAPTEALSTLQPDSPSLKPESPADSDFVAVRDYIPDIIVDLKYASDNNFTGETIYEFDDAYLRYGTVKKLIEVSRTLAEQGLRLKIWDAFRPASAQFKLWEVCPDANYVANPYAGFSSHSRGNTIDITLTDSSGNELEMPSGFDDFSALADRDYSDCTPTAAANALLLQQIMEKNGFYAYSMEWWHFSDNTAYPAEECFDPALISTWYAYCSEYINLRVSPDYSAEAIAQIPAGDNFTLLGRTGAFSLVDYKGLRGYVASEFTRPSGDAPADEAAWTPNCEEFISLHSSPGGTDVILRIPLGENITLEKWCGKYACVTYKGIRGYVSADYIKPADGSYFEKQLKVIQPGCSYSYEQMLADISALKALYPDMVSSSVIGKSESGLDIPVIRLGQPDAEYHVLIQAAIHGREHMTAWLAMAIADHSLAAGYMGSENICYHIIPMSNPDGVCISQSGTLGDAQLLIYQSDKAAGYTAASADDYAVQWKANSLGTDLNRNFPSGWDACDKRSQASSEQYRGASPFSASETAALRDYTLKYDFDATISLHSSGDVIYYRYGNNETANECSLSLAQAIEKISGCYPEETDGTDGAGYKDWAIDELGIPSVTIELGCSACPLPERELYNLFDRCRQLLPAVTAWVISRDTV